MPTKLDTRQSVNRSALSMTGSAANDSLDTILPKIDAEMAKLFEDRNLMLADGGLITFAAAGTSVTFSQALTLHVNSQVAGGAPTVISLAATTRAFSANLRMLYAVIDRGAGTATVTADATTLPAVTSANQEVVLIAKRVDSADGSARLIFRNGAMFFAGQAKRLGTADFLQQTVATDSTSTGSLATLPAITTGVVRLTNAGLVSISGITAGVSGQSLILENAAGNPIQILNDDAGATAADRIYTGSGTASLPNQSSFIFTYDSTNQRWMLTGGSGSGSGGGLKNYITNPTAEANAADYNLYLDAAGPAPVDGTGGSPVGVTFTRTTTTPLRGLGSFAFAKDAVNRQGTGVSTDFVIDLADRAKVMQITFDYQLISGTFNAGSPGADSDFTVWIYDKTNGVMIQPTTYKVFSNSSTVPNQFISNFQTASNSVDYRLIFHIGTTSAAAWSMMLDTVSVSPTQYQYNTVITDWKLETIALGTLITTTGGSLTFNTPTVPLKFMWRRVGSEAQIKAMFTGAQPAISAGAAGDYLFNIPAFIGKIDTSKTGSGTTSGLNDASIGMQSMKVGTLHFTDNNGPRKQWSGHAFVRTDSTLMFLGLMGISSGVSANSGVWSSSGSPGVNEGDLGASITQAFAFEINVPILGWSVQQQTSDLNDQRAVVWTARGTTQFLTGTYGTPIKLDVTENDTHAGWDSITHVYTVQVPGDYIVMFSAWDDGGGTTNWNVYKNQSIAGGGTPYAGLGSSTNYNLGSGAYTMANLKVGDTLFFAATSGSQYVSAFRSASIVKIGSPSQISTTETIACIITGTPASAATNAPIIFPTVQKDTHNNYNATTGQYKIAQAGFYSVEATLSASVGNNLMSAYVNGTIRQTMGIGVAASGFAQGSTRIYCNAGDLVDVRIVGGTGGTSGTSTLTIMREGI